MFYCFAAVDFFGPVSLVFLFPNHVLKRDGTGPFMENLGMKKYTTTKTEADP